MRAEDIVDWLKSHVEPGAKLRLDSRQVQPGDVFFACPGLAGDGRDHIGAALDAGAAAVVVQAPLPEYLAPAKGRAHMLEVPGLTGLLGQTAHVWYGEPSHNLSVVADICHRVTVLQRGEILAEGDYATVAADPRVRTAYMGTEG